MSSPNKFLIDGHKRSHDEAFENEKNQKVDVFMHYIHLFVKYKIGEVLSSKEYDKALDIATQRTMLDYERQTNLNFEAATKKLKELLK